MNPIGISMFCPKCGLERVSEATAYCSGCGFQMSQIEPFLDTPIKRKKRLSKLRRGLMQSYLLFASVVVVFILGQIANSIFRGADRWFIISSLILLVLGVFRLIYAIFFESEVLGSRDGLIEVETIDQLEPKQIEGRSFVPVQSVFQGSGATTNDLAAFPDSVTDLTTKSLRREEE